MSRRGRAWTSSIGPLLVGLLAAFVAGLIAIGFLLRYLRTRSLDVFVVYRFVLAAVVVVLLARSLGRGGPRWRS